MMYCLDVHYRAAGAVAGAAGFARWDDASASSLTVVAIPAGRVAAYVPGELYRRELPCLLAVVAKLPEPPALLVIDGYVWLGDGSRPGLGAHLFEALDGRVPVVGVAKAKFRAAIAADVLRGRSRRPLHVTAAGLAWADAAAAVASMHGRHRIPTLLQRVDRLCRDA